MTLHLKPVENRSNLRPRLKAMHLNPVTLRFSGPLSHLERLFQKDYLDQSIPHIRLVLILAAILYAIFGILDYLLVPGEKYLFWTIRYAFVCPVLILTAIVLRFQTVQNMIQPILSGLIVISGSGIIAMILIAPPPINYSYYAGLILAFMFGYTFVRAQFIWASLGAWCLVILYEIAAIGIAKTPVPVLLNNNFFFISANLIGMLACYFIELYARRDFYLVYLLADEREKVQVANLDLEQRVRARTIELEAANQELGLEIKERRYSEAERSRLADQLKQAEKMEAIGSMAAGVAHDLNNILSGLVSYPDLLLLDLNDESPLRQPILTIKKSGEKAAAMVQDLLALARRGVIHKEVVNPNDLISEYLVSPEFAGLEQQHPNVRFTVDLAADLLKVLVSPVHLLKAIMNLTSNAAEALLVKGEVAIKTQNRSLGQPLSRHETIVAGDYVTIQVYDSGVGIAEQDLERIFEPFYTKKQLGRSGTGLGMTVVWSTIKDADGYIDIESKEGYGTTFTLYLPANRQPAMVTESPVLFENLHGTEKVLVVDDMAEQREIAKAMLGKLGYAVTAVPSGEAALDYLKENEVDIVVLAMIMDPGMDGCETYRRILEQRPQHKAVIASGFSESKRVREAQRMGAGAYIKKPYTLEKIALAVREALDG